MPEKAVKRDFMDGPDEKAKEERKTPLNLACYLKKPKIVEAILCQAKPLEPGGSHLMRQVRAEKIDINSTANYGDTAFITACKNGWTEIVALMLEMAQDVAIDFNARHRLDGRTGFIYACFKKHMEIVDLLKANAEDLPIDLHVIDDYGNSGFDYLLPTWKKNFFSCCPCFKSQ